jgi:hypothetical protein
VKQVVESRVQAQFRIDFLTQNLNSKN